MPKQAARIPERRTQVRRLCAASIAAVCLLARTPAFAQDAIAPAAVSGAEDAAELETKNIFGFTSGTDIGPEHDLELEFETGLEFGKRSGAYNAGEQFVTLEYNPTAWLEVDSRLRVSFNDIKGVEGFDDRTGANFGGLAGKYSFVLIHRAPATPFGLTVSVEPEWSRVDDGGRINSAFSAETRIIVDTELVASTLYAAANLIYQPLESRNFGAAAFTPSADFGVAMALAYRLDAAIAPGPKQIVVGAELEYHRAHDGLGLSRFSGDALSFGPTFYIHINDKLFLAGAISTQIAGRAIGDPGPLNLVNFSRNKAQVTMGIEF